MSSRGKSKLTDIFKNAIQHIPKVENTEPMTKTKSKKGNPNAVKEKKKISNALRQQVWIQNKGEVFKSKCDVTWCKNIITVFNFECGHDIPESKGGPTNITNLYPICGSCNRSMGNQYTYKEWCKLYLATTHPIAPSSSEHSFPSPPFPPPPIPQEPRPNTRRTWFEYFFCGKKNPFTST